MEANIKNDRELQADKSGEEKLQANLKKSVKHNPVSDVRWVPIDQVQANDYNPNSVATNEMKLLYLSIKEDGYTQPVVTIWDESIKKYVIIDGFHRYTTMRMNKDIYELNGGLLPIVVLNKTMAERMASTVRHNRARGKHSVTGMSNMVFKMLDEGLTDEQICNQLGMESEELLRLKHITGFSKLFENVEYKRAWETKVQLKLKRSYHDNAKNGDSLNVSDKAVLEKREGQQ